MRISGGRARGIVLRVPRNAAFRPAIDRLRQGVFSSIGARVEGARFIDLFAGTGSYGLEALSRGAAGGWFVENDRAVVAALRVNIAAVSRSAGCGESLVRVNAGDAMLWTPPGGEPADLVFTDPPFAEIPTLAESLFRRVAGFLRTDPPGTFVFEMPGELELESPGWRMVRRIGHGRGQPTCCIYEPA
jgi:16S rRNA (guanine966-N2)-methyltransferase